MEAVSIVLFLLLAVVLSGSISRMLPVPVPTPLVQIMLGAVIGLSTSYRVALDPELFLLLFLPPLLFLDGWRIPKDELLKDISTVVELALGLVVDLYDSATIPTLRARFSPAAERKVGIGMKIDDKPDLRLPISDCNKARCEATGRLTQQVLSLWSSGKQAQFAYLLKGGKQVVLPLSLNGFDRALAALRWAATASL